jgi:hypothetical protein
MSDFKAKITKFDFGWGGAPDPLYTYSWILQGLLVRGEEGKGKQRGRGEDKAGEREGPHAHPLCIGPPMC